MLTRVGQSDRCSEANPGTRFGLSNLCKLAMTGRSFFRAVSTPLVFVDLLAS
jgi:hypothetical protein